AADVNHRRRLVIVSLSDSRNCATPFVIWRWKPAMRIHADFQKTTFISCAAAALLCLGCEGNGPGPADPDAPTEFTTTSSGLKYKVLRKSNGKKPKASSFVTAKYRGWLDDGTEFDSTYTKGSGAIGFPLANVVPGWREGLQLVGEGGMIELEIPSNLGYGP